MDEAKRPDEAKLEPELKRPDEAIEDLEPDQHEADAVTGGYFTQGTKTKPETY